MKGKPLLLVGGIVLILVVILCLCLFGLTIIFGGFAALVPVKTIDTVIDQEYPSGDNNMVNDTIVLDEDKCDDSNSEYFSFMRKEETIVSINPCKVIWLLAKSSENYSLTTKNGTTIYVQVWQNYNDNVTPGSTYTIRALDVFDDGISKDRENSGIAITRWVANKASLPSAKEEINNTIRNLDY